MRNFKSYLLLLLVAIVPVAVLAVEETKVENLDDLKTCVKEKGSICKLNANIVLDSALEIGKEVTIDLNNYSVTPKTEGYADDSVITVLRGGKLTVKDSGTKGTINSGEVSVGIKMTKYGESAEGDVATLVVDGGTIYGKDIAISGNGSRHNTSVTINGGTLDSDDTAIYHPQNGTLVVNDGTIYGELTGIELRSGSLTVNGGTITGNGNPFEQEQNGSGTTTIGAGVAVVQHTTQLVASATINGGTIKGYRSVVQNNVQKNSDEAVAKVSLNITGGNFEIINNGDYVVLSDNLSSFVSGGTYSIAFNAKYLKDNYNLKQFGDVYKVALSHVVTLSETKNGTVEFSEIDNLFAGETVEIITTPNDGYELSLIKVVDADKNAVEVVDGKFVMPDSDVTVTAEFSKIPHIVFVPTVVVPEEEVEEALVGVEESETVEEVLLKSLEEAGIDEDSKGNVTVSLEIYTMEEEAIDEKIIEKMEEKIGDAKIATYFDISVTVRDNFDNSFVGNLPELTEEIELMILLPENLKNTNKDVDRVYYVVRRHVDEKNNETFELLETKLSEDGNYLIFKTDKFSTYALAYEDVEVNEEVLPPKTFDGIGTYFVVGALSLITLAGISIFAKKKMFN